MNVPVPLPLRDVFAATFGRLLKPFTLFVWGASWIASVLAGPFGTYAAMSFGMRVIYWGILVSLGVVLGFATYAMTIHLLKSERRRIFPIVAAAIMTVAYAPLVIALRTGFSSAAEGLDVNGLAITVNVFVVTAAVFLFRQVLHKAPLTSPFETSETSEIEQSTEVEPVPRLMRRLSDDVKGHILRLSANNHHVDVVTVNGTAVLRMRLTDAIDEMEPIKGLCVHRSHWVTHSAIARIERMSAHKTCVHLINGDEIPASRKYRDNLVEAGLIEDTET